jgi:AcrR family transcriptional regulator
MELLKGRQAHKQAFRARILKNAEDLFLTKRYSSITIDEIAARAGITKRTIYKHFSSKLALYVSMFDDYLKRLSDEIIAAAQIDMPADQLVAGMWEVLFSFTRKNERFMRLYWMVDSDEFEGEIPDELLRHVQEHTINMFAASVRANARAIKEGLLADVDPLLLAHLMSAINKGIFIHASKERRFNISRLTADELNGLMITILQHGLFKTPTSQKTAGSARKTKK